MPNILYVEMDSTPGHAEYKSTAMKLIREGYMFKRVDRSELPYMLVFVKPFTQSMEEARQAQLVTGLLVEIA